MWVCTIDGFFSVVCGRNDNGEVNPEVFMVRARVLQHLVNLCERYDLPHKIITNDDTDYRYRIILPKHQWLFLSASWTREVDYGNFKDAVAGQPEQDFPYLEALVSMWFRLKQLTCTEQLDEHSID